MKFEKPNWLLRIPIEGDLGVASGGDQIGGGIGWKGGGRESAQLIAVDMRIAEPLRIEGEGLAGAIGHKSADTELVVQVDRVLGRFSISEAHRANVTVVEKPNLNLIRVAHCEKTIANGERDEVAPIAEIDVAEQSVVASVTGGSVEDVNGVALVEEAGGAEKGHSIDDDVAGGGCSGVEGFHGGSLGGDIIGIVRLRWRGPK